MTPDLTGIENASLLAYLLVFLGGVVTSIGPCNVAMVPLVIGFVGGRTLTSRWQSFTLSLTFAVGLALTFMALGVIAALFGGLIGGETHVLYYLVAAVCIVLGLHLLGVFTIAIPEAFAQQRERIRRRGLLGALLLGLVSGLVASQCATPVLAAILTLVMVKGTVVYGATLLFVYALGRGVPVVLAGTFAGVSKSLLALGRWNIVLERASGLVIIAVGLYFLWIA